MLNVWYLCHSGFAVETDRHFFVFDYWKDTPRGGLSAGVIAPWDLAGTGKTFVVFASHRHPDHFNPIIFDWKRRIPSINLILSSDIPLPQDIEARVMGPGEELAALGLHIGTLASNDEGVAFLVTLNKQRIFHAGDLNWWHWESEPDEWNNEMGRFFKAELDKLRGVPIDLAFVPVDPRLGAHGILGIDCLMRTLTVKTAIPMHFWQSEDEAAALLDSPICKDYRERIILLRTRGQRISL